MCDRHAEGEKRWDLRFGVVASAYINCHLKKGAQPIPAGRWFGYNEPAEEQSDEQMLATMQAFSAQHNKNLGK